MVHEHEQSNYLTEMKITEKIKGSQQGQKMKHDDGKDSFLGPLLVLPVEL